MLTRVTSVSETHVGNGAGGVWELAAGESGREWEQTMAVSRTAASVSGAARPQTQSPQPYNPKR